MNSTLANIIDNTSPKFNKEVTDGNIKRVLQGCPEWLDSVFRSAIKSLSPKVDMEYLGYRRLSPLEEYDSYFSGTPKKASYDIAISDIHVVEFAFRYGKDIITRQLYLPMALDGNLVRISSAIYALTPIMSDSVISPSDNQVFVRLLKNKLIFGSFSYNIVQNGTRKLFNLIYNTVLENSKLALEDNIGKFETSSVFYLLGKYGLRGTLTKYCNIKKKDAFIITEGDASSLMDKYNVFESTQIKPKNHKDKFYKPHKVKLCLDKKISLTPFLRSMIVGVIYILDILPDFASDLVVLDTNNNLPDEQMYWRILLGRIAYNNTYSVDRIGLDTESLFTTLEGYLDNLIQEKLADAGVHVENFYDLVYYILENYDMWSLNSKTYNSDINNKYLDIYYYILYDIIIGFNRVILSINRRAEKKQDTVDLKEINRKFANEIGLRKIFGIVKAKRISLAVQSISDYTLDIKYPKITSLLEDQSRGEGVKRSSTQKFPPATKFIKANQMYFGSLLFLSKTAASPVFKANMYMKYDLKTGKLMIDNELQRKLDKIDKLLMGRQEDIDGKIEVYDSDDTESDGQFEEDFELPDEEEISTEE